ncbi:MAG: hypothetical protein ACXAC5_05025 [Promethearchaeota archaeon]|jgi:hypothetical protein
MPEIIVGIAMLLCVIFALAAFFSYDKCIPCGIALSIIFGLLLSWEIVANSAHEIESKKTYKVTTMGESPTNMRQVAITESGPVDATARTYKVIDEEKCKLLITEWETFSWGMLMMFGGTDDYSVVCPEVE